MSEIGSNPELFNNPEDIEAMEELKKRTTEEAEEARKENEKIAILKPETLERIERIRKRKQRPPTDKELREQELEQAKKLIRNA